MSMRHKREGQHQPQEGFVSIIVTMIIMVLLSLIVIGFAKISRREQRQGLDRQLISQAQYAAESGINDAQNFLKNGGSLSSTANTMCNSYAVGGVESQPSPAGGLPKASKIDGDNTVLSCVLVDSQVTNLVYDKVDTNSQVVMPLSLVSGGAINTVTVSWQDGSAPTQDFSAGSTLPCRTDLNLPKSTAWSCPAGALRVDVVPTQVSALGRAQLNNNVKGLLLVPQQTSASSPATTVNVPGLADSAAVQGVSCKGVSGASARMCTATLTVAGATSYYLRIHPVYRSADIEVRVNADAAGVGAKMTGSQAIIDSTARANDVIKRFVARVPICASGQACGVQPAGFALQSADTICKKYTLMPATGVLNGSSVDPSCELP